MARNVNTNEAIIETRDLTQSYVGVTALKGVNLEIYEGQFTWIAGESGSGKTTLMGIIAGLTKPDNGSVYVSGQEITSLNGKALDIYRGSVGKIYQKSGMIPGLTVKQNIKVPHSRAGRRIDQEYTAALTQHLGMASRLNQEAATLSGGQQQRAALIRALAARPNILLADEPTASLDSGLTVEYHEIIQDLVQDTGLTVVMTSHDQTTGNYADRIIELRDGEVSGISENVRNIT